MIGVSRPQIDQQEVKAVLAVLRSRNLVQGKQVSRLEKKFSQTIGCRYAVATSSGTTALHLSLLAAGIRPGDEVITTAFSFIASANCCLFVGARPVFVDIKADDFTLDPNLIETAITPKTKAILPVHLFGCPAEMKKIIVLARKYRLKIIEDCCQAHGASLNSKKVGSLGLAGCFSFYATKNIMAGEGGMITTNSLRLARLCQKLRNHGSLVRYYHEILGYNFRMTEIEAALTLVQLKKLKLNNLIRRRNSRCLGKIIKAPGIVLPKFSQHHSWHQYTIRVTKDYPLTRDQLKTKLLKQGIGAEIYYPIPIHKQPLYQNLGYHSRLPVTETASREVLSLPIHPEIKQRDLFLTAKVINNPE